VLIDKDFDFIDPSETRRARIPLARDFNRWISPRMRRRIPCHGSAYSDQCVRRIGTAAAAVCIEAPSETGFNLPIRAEACVPAERIFFLPQNSSTPRDARTSPTGTAPVRRDWRTTRTMSPTDAAGWAATRANRIAQQTSSGRARLPNLVPAAVKCGPQRVCVVDMMHTDAEIRRPYDTGTATGCSGAS
jgi:hypothetical protein